jgi:hypothetical protein
MPNPTPKGDRKRTNIRLPRALMREIRTEAAQTDRTATDIIVEQLALRYPDLTLDFFVPRTEARVSARGETALP